jgi:hypothetical protein
LSSRASGTRPGSPAPPTPWAAWPPAAPIPSCWPRAASRRLLAAQYSRSRVELVLPLLERDEVWAHPLLAGVVDERAALTRVIADLGLEPS